MELPQLQFLNLPQIDASIQQARAAEMQNALAPYLLQKTQMDVEKGNLEMQAYKDRIDREKRIKEAIASLSSQDAAPAAGQPTISAQARPVSYSGPDNPMSPRVAGPDWMPSPPAQEAQMPQQQAQPGAGRTKQDLMGNFIKQAEIYAKNGDPETANKLYEHAAKFMPEVHKIEVAMDNGKPVNVITFKDGTQQVSAYGATPKLHFADNGQFAAIPVDEYTGATVGGGIQKQVAPDALLTDARTRAEGAANRQVTIRGQDMADARAKEGNAIQAGNKQQQGAIELRKEFNALQEVKNYKEVLPIIQSVERAPNTPAGDIDLIYGVGKIMDPNSVVREGEMDLAIKAGSPAQRLMGYVSYVKGGGRLSQSQREELLQVMRSRVDGLKTNYDTARATYETAADQQGLPKDQIFIEPGAPTKPPSPPGANKKSAEAPGEWAGMNANYATGRAGRDSEQLAILQDELARETDPKNRAALMREIDRVQKTQLVADSRENKAPPKTTNQAVVAIPKTGERQDGYMFLGGDPSDPKRWKKVN